MKPLKFGNQIRNTNGRRPLGKGSRKANSDAYWQLAKDGKPLPEGLPPGAFVPKKRGRA